MAPKLHIVGISKDLYISSLVFKFVCLLLMKSVLSMRNWEFSCNHLILICRTQVSQRLSVSRRYLTVEIEEFIYF